MNGLRIGLEGIRPSAATVESLVSAHGNRIYKLAYQLTGSAADAEDVLQETFFRLFRNWFQLATCANIGGWITRVVTNAAIDLLRSRKSRLGAAGSAPLALLPARVEKPSAALESEELGRKLEEALTTLPPRQLAALILYDHEGFKGKEVARLLGISESAVRSYVFEARRKVKDLLAPYFRGTER